MVRIALKVQRKRQGLDQLVLQFPGIWLLNPADAGVFTHPGREDRLAGTERHPRTTTDPPQLQAQTVHEQAPERESQGRSFGVAAVVITNSRSEGLSTSWETLSKQPGGNANVEQCGAANDMTPLDWDRGGDFAEVPGVNSGCARYRSRSLQHLGSIVHVVRL